MTKTKSHWFRMVYIEIQNKKKKKNQFRDEKNELQSVSFNWYLIDRKSHINKKSANVKSP